jgi:hypothetical protein
MTPVKITDASRRSWMRRFLAEAERMGVEQVSDTEAVKAVQLLEAGFKPETIARSFYSPPCSNE